MTRSEVSHPIHDHLTQMSAEDEVEHLHAGCDVGYCSCAPGILAAVVRAVIAEHHPFPSRNINSLGCDAHHPIRNRDGHLEATRTPGVFDACPDCVVTPLVVCSCWGCTDYPCQTVTGVAEARGLDVEAMT